jgi:hypothetical protein
MSDVTQILSRIESGDSAAAKQLLPLISRSTAHRHWTYARAWLRDAINGTKNND